MAKLLVSTLDVVVFQIVPQLAKSGGLLMEHAVASNGGIFLLTHVFLFLQHELQLEVVFVHL